VFDFEPVHAAMRRYVASDLLAGLSSAVLRGSELVDLHCVGWADREQGVALNPQHLFRIFSNTKLITSCAVLRMMEEGRLGLDDPIEGYLPQLGARRVLRTGAQDLADTEPARGSITVRHLLTHSSGLTSGILDAQSPLYAPYLARGVRDPNTTLASMVDALADLPLAFHPGTQWEYSMATDVLARLLEVVSGQALDQVLRDMIFEPLGMNDTFFWVPPNQQHRLVAYYAGASLTEPMHPGLSRTDNAPYPEAYRRPFARLSGGGGLVSSLGDMIKLVRALMPPDPDRQWRAADVSSPYALLRPQTLALMMKNQLADGLCLKSSVFGEVRGKGHGLAGAVTRVPSGLESPNSVGEFHWGGIAGTHWWIHPQHRIAGVVMTQRHWAFWHPFAFDWKRTVYQAVLGD
jgi:CubicO group peptidase (beta-lactamase class C family)